MHITEHKRAVVDVLDWLTDHDALRLSTVGGNWAHAATRRCPLRHRPRRVRRTVPACAARSSNWRGRRVCSTVPNPSQQRQSAAPGRRAAGPRLLIEHPVL